MLMDRWFFLSGCIGALLGVALGAFAAHALKGSLAPELLAAFETGVRYQLYHALALMAVAWASTRWPGKMLNAGGLLLFVGMLFFSGSLYALSLTGIRGLGMITPFGGLMLLAGWLCVAWGVWKHR
jgi:uncharacterized membrane protein YgdD (TMEM256/DUF423 family)